MVVDKKKRKRVCPPTFILHENIISSILAKLPSKSLIRFKSACKSWDSLISSPYFINLHLQRHNMADQLQKSECGILISYQISFTNRVRFYAVEHLKHSLTIKFLFEKELPIVESETFVESDYMFNIIQHCDGLLLFQSLKLIFVCNPTTRELLLLPSSSNPDTLVHDVHQDTVGFGFDHSTKRYKIVRYFYRSIDIVDRSYSLGLEVFTLGLSETWRQTTEVPPYPVRDTRIASAEGAVYWKIWNDIHTLSPRAILRFDLTDEKFRVIEPPPLFRSNLAAFQTEKVNLIGIQGKLFCVHSCQPIQDAACLWMMNKEEKWVLTYRFSFEPGLDACQPIAVDRGNLLIIMKSVLYDFNPKTNSLLVLIDDVPSLIRDVRKLEDADFRDYAYYTPTCYLESLVPIGGR